METGRIGHVLEKNKEKMQIADTQLEGVKIIECFHAKDERGSFTKLFHEQDFARMGIPMQTKEIYYSISQKDVIRGMHFQMPP